VSSSSTLYSVVFDTLPVVEKGVDSILQAPVYRDGALVEPTSATCAVYDSSNTSVSSGSATITGDVATYTVSAASTSSRTPEEGWRLEWVITLSDGEVLRPAVEAVLALRRLRPVVSDQDLLRYHPALTRRRPSTETSYQDYLDATWREVEAKLIASGKRPWLVISPQALRGYHLSLTLSAIYRDFATGGPGSTEWALSDKYEAQAQGEWASLVLSVADASTGQADSGAAREGVQPSFWLGSGRRSYL
jgi:hypothetical protein